MPSPFPGLGPYLEGSLWTTFHFALGAEIVRQLAPRLRPRYLVLPVERFLKLPIPLLPGGPDALLDLQQTFTTVYDLLGYDLALDYIQPPDVALEGEAVLLADELLQAVGKRQA